ncbi:hypothetical protein SAMN05192530_103242 [Aureimonas jatrophae]|uniref:Uncharacterized protein n=1 Tax=Aureimonas jatrophae TaxID=1166073 RepID=A0A1H0GPS1_9HYPH|nr:hypothetical protein SAMN05192530_103242 [Aureimonas jatrophae]
MNAVRSQVKAARYRRPFSNGTIAMLANYLGACLLPIAGLGSGLIHTGSGYRK